MTPHPKSGDRNRGAWLLTRNRGGWLLTRNRGGWLLTWLRRPQLNFCAWRWRSWGRCWPWWGVRTCHTPVVSCGGGAPRKRLFAETLHRRFICNIKETCLSWKSHRSFICNIKYTRLSWSVSFSAFNICLPTQNTNYYKQKLNCIKLMCVCVCFLSMDIVHCQYATLRFWCHFLYFKQESSQTADVIIGGLGVGFWILKLKTVVQIPSKAGSQILMWGIFFIKILSLVDSISLTGS